VKKVTEKGGQLLVYLMSYKRYKAICSQGGTEGPGHNTLHERQWKHVPLWGIPVLLLYRLRGLEYAACGVKVESIPWTQGNSPLSLPLSLFLDTWTREVAGQVVGRLFEFH
jgi:hypothetical protein